jgi:hypothetical protein
MKRFRTRLALTALALGASATVPAATVWDESLDADFSGDFAAPTALAFGLGSNVILGTTGDPGQGTDRDYFSFVVPEGAVLTSLILLDNTFVSGGVSFIGLQVGARFTRPFDQIQASDLLGFLHYDTGFVGRDMLSLIDGPFAGLPSGVYTAWVQDTGGGTAAYGFDFNVTAAPVPLPGAVWLLASGALGLGALRRRRGTPAASR